MATGIIEAIVAALKSIPYFDKWFTKAEQDKETSARADVDKEAQNNEKDGRPSNDFWDDRHV
jgi:hypothetical protein